jgi:hypothetical protein
VPAGVATDPGRNDRSIVIVGGGIAGLYAAYLLGLLKRDVQLFEMSDRWGGRIDSEVFKLDPKNDFVAEFGPMRFEAHLQERLRELCFQLGIGFEPFSPTSAPVGTTHYDLTATEESLESPADLLQWGVLKMFFEADIKRQLDAIEQAEEKKNVNRAGPKQLKALRRHMDSEYFCVITGDGRSMRVAAMPDSEVQAKLDSLRDDATLRGEEGSPPLATMGLWNALSEVISPGALARIRDSGTFYHFLAENPSALEWGIFWLRQASVTGGLFRFDRKGAPGGTHSLVTNLVSQIERDCPDNVHLYLRREVVALTHGKRAHEVVLCVVSHDEDGGPYTFSQAADDVILALPRQPLLKLSEHFPQDVSDRLEGVVAMPLLKAFLVTKNPWWRHHLEAQSFAWLVPTRELHFFRPSSTECPSVTNPRLKCTCEDSLDANTQKLGMIMLYTDHPAIKYWQGLMVPAQLHERYWEVFDDEHTAIAEVKADGHGLLASLIRRLLMIPEPGLARKINFQAAKIERALERRYPELATRIAEAPGETLKLAEQIYRATLDDKTAQGQVEGVIARKEIGIGIKRGSSWHSWLDLAIRYAPSRGKHVAETEKLANDVRAYGIRDWSADPFGGASHVWLPFHRSRSHASGDPLIAFSLRGRADSLHENNVHVCGEAYSGFQGFIEGALRTAEEVVDSIAGSGSASSAMSLKETADRKKKRSSWDKRQPAELTKRWKAPP